jgi:hypothetical protein
MGQVAPFNNERALCGSVFVAVEILALLFLRQEQGRTASLGAKLYNPEFYL